MLLNPRASATPCFHMSGNKNVYQATILSNKYCQSVSVSKHDVGIKVTQPWLDSLLSH